MLLGHKVQHVPERNIMNKDSITLMCYVGKTPCKETISLSDHRAHGSTHASYV